MTLAAALAADAPWLGLREEVQALVEGRDGPVARWLAHVLVDGGARGLQRLGGGLYYVERCARYLQEAAGCGYRTALRVWDEVRAALGWREVRAREALARGARLRELGARQRWGRHIILTEGQVEDARALLALARSRGLCPVSTSHPRHPGWELQRPNSPRRTWSMRCPHHEDRDPSLVLWDGPGHGGGLCMSCRARFRWAGDRLYPASDGPVGEPSRPLHTRRKQERPPRGPEGYLRQRKQEQGGRRGRRWTSPPRPSQASIHATMLWHERRSRGLAPLEAACAAARGLAPAGKWELPTPLAGATLSKASGWRLAHLPGREVWLPTGWVPLGLAAASWDLDGAEIPLEEEDLASGIVGLKPRCPGLRGALASALEGVPGLSGELSVVLSGPRGVHVHAGLDRLVPAGEWLEWRTWYDRLGARLALALARWGAHGAIPDPACAGLGRMWRAPSWRLVGPGTLFRTRLLSEEG